MTANHLITPPPELVEEWANAAAHEFDIAKFAARWGADRELEACCEWLRNDGLFETRIGHLRTARRPKPPSLKEQALIELGDVYNRNKIDDVTYDTIRRALEQLDD